MNDTALMREFIETASENAAMKVASELRKDLSKVYERMGKLENIVGVNCEGTPNGNGIKGQVDKMDRRCAARATDCETKFNAIRHLSTSPAKEVNTWKQRLIGAVWFASVVGGVVLGAAAFHQYLK